jgi:hypothetical protein
MRTSISEAEFDVMVAQTGLPLSAEQKRTLHEVYWIMEAMIARVNKPMPLAAEPAHIFIPEAQ